MSKHLKYFFLLFLIFFFGIQTTYAKTELIYPTKSISFSIEQNQSFKSLEKEVQPNIGFLKEKTKFGLSEGVSAQNTYDFSERVSKDVAKGVGVFGKVTKTIVKQEIPAGFMNALKKFGKTEDKILDYFTDYHNNNGFRFLNEIEEVMKHYPFLTKTEAYATWGYTTKFFYGDLNLALRNKENLSQLADLKSILSAAIRKMPKYQGIAYRSIKLDGEALVSFLSKHEIGKTVKYDDFVSCGSTKAAAFFDKSEKNVRLIMEVKNAPKISDFADGVKFRGYAKDELLLLTGSKFKITGSKTINGVYEIRLKQIN